MESYFETLDRLRRHYGRDALAFASDVEAALLHPVDRTRDELNQAVRKRWPSSGDVGPWVWVTDFHDEWVIVSVELTNEHYYVRVPYSWEDGKVVLGDEEERVRRVENWEKARAFVTEVNGKTILTSPVSLQREAASLNPLYLYIGGKFVGAEKANRNGALWTTADLEMGEPSVRNGPLNWLHEERHIIGTLVSSTLRAPETAAESFDPYIGVDSVVWKWIYPQEAATIEMASEQAKLWYSMECISERVHCGACEGVYPYLDVIRASEEVCDHVRYKQATRRFESPTFLGGAVIVPPVRPGWSDANIEILRQGASLTEKAYEQAGSRAGLDDGEWERLMAQIVRFAS